MTGRPLPSPGPGRAFRTVPALPGGGFTLSVGGLALRVRPVGACPPLGVEPAALPFVAGTDRVDCEVAVSAGCPTLPSAPVAFDSGALWRLHRAVDGWEVSLSADGAEPYAFAVLSPGFEKVSLVLARDHLPPVGAVYPLQYPLDELLTIHLLAAAGGVELHACGIRDRDGRGILLAGHSGAGKSTSAAFWTREEGATVLSDDRILLREVGGVLRMYGTPWHGDAGLADPGWAPLAALFVLAHGTEERFVEWPTAEAVARLLVRSFVPFHLAGALDAAMAFLERAVAAIPCGELSFRPGPEVVSFTRGLLR